jgi:hypothetical protein
MQLDGNHHCGTVILTERFVITAAHCTYGRNSSQLTICAGNHRLSETCRQKRNIDRIIQHPNYIHVGLKNDIALLRLATPLNMSDPAVRRVCLPHRSVDPYDYPPAGTNVIAIGWGRLSTQGPLSDELNQVTFNVLDASTDKCYYAEDSRTQLCASEENKGKIEK